MANQDAMPPHSHVDLLKIANELKTVCTYKRAPASFHSPPTLYAFARQVRPHLFPLTPLSLFISRP